MEVKYSYSKTQLEETVKYISRKNEHFQGQKDYIRNEIMRTMDELAKNSESLFAGTMGFIVIADREFEGIDGDSNTVLFEFVVNPALCMDIDAEDYIEEIINV